MPFCDKIYKVNQSLQKKKLKVFVLILKYLVL